MLELGRDTAWRENYTHTVMAAKKNNKWCFIPECTSTSISTPGKIFVTVPTEPRRKFLWFVAAKRDQPTSRTGFYCCEDHFNLEEDLENYVKFKLMGGRVLLKKSVVPHIFDCRDDTKRATTASMRSAKRKKQQRIGKALKFCKNEPESCIEPAEVPTIGNVNEIADTSVKLEIKEEPIAETDYECPPEIEIKTVATEFLCVDEKVQVQPSDLNTIDTTISRSNTPSNVLKFASQSEFSAESGSDSNGTIRDVQLNNSDEFSVENDSDRTFSYVQITMSFISRNPKVYIGVTDEWFKDFVNFLNKNSRIANEHALLTLMKIKLNDSFARLGDQFDLSEGHVRRIFNKSVVVIARLLRKLIYWPEKARIIKLLPMSFRPRYRNVQSIINFLEIQIEKPKDPFKQTLTWSEHKKCNTLKYLISCTPDGFVNFISPGCGGRTSDAELFKQSGYLEQLRPGCSVIADRGFNDLQKLVEDKQCTVVKPPNVDSVQPSKMEVKRNASLRMRIESIIRRLGDYEYLKPHSVIRHSLIGKTDDVVAIACALTNLQSSVIKQI